MTVLHDVLIAVYDSSAKARPAVQALLDVGVPNDKVSVVVQGDEATAEVLNRISRGEEIREDAGMGAAIGGLGGLLAGIALIPVAGLGPVVFTGPIATAMVGGAGGGLLGAITGWGIAESKVAGYERKIREGGVLVAVDGNVIDIAVAKKVLEETNVSELEYYSKANQS
ncbi:MAG: hypothetical protein DWQ35_19710 [Planctomycetota bacterium]|nr:MAG: hypothetical protein DWQ35_19710 [Planctomycetota bacterium]